MFEAWWKSHEFEYLIFLAFILLMLGVAWAAQWFNWLPCIPDELEIDEDEDDPAGGIEP